MGGRERRGGGEWEAKRGVGREWGEQAWGVWHRASEDIRRLDLDLPGREKSPRRARTCASCGVEGTVSPLDGSTPLERTCSNKNKKW